MAEYIDREKMLKYLEENNTADEWIVGQYNADWIYSFIESQPTADVVAAVRCKDCQYCTIHNSPTLYAYCEKTHFRFEPFETDTRTHFCSYGERKDDNDV